MTSPSDQGGPITNRVPVSIQDELRTSYLDYAMSVIIGRAIPDVRDGLKPVHRRILYSMWEQGITAQSSYKKCARVVGDVLGKYHPHGDAAVYDALVRMAQDFSLRVPLIDGQGNYGSIDGDSAAAMRYTECRLAAVTGELLADLDKATVDFVPNYDESEEEPSVLPARFPQLLVNGSGGIAVGMATNIPPHNLGEIVDATIALIEDPTLEPRRLLELVPGPDFPTGGQIYGLSGIHQAYATGRGSIVMRAKTHVEHVQGAEGREQIVIDEVPYQVNKARLCARISELVKEKKIEGISEVRDESDRDGIRVVIELKRDVFPQVVLNHLYRQTPMQQAFGVINLAICDGKPRVLDLRETLQYFIDHRREVVRRRSRFELKKAEERREIVLGLGMATTDIERVIETIRRSQDPDEARVKLMQLPLRGLADFLARAGSSEEEVNVARGGEEYFLSERQAKAILEMRLARLTGLERDKLASEFHELTAQIRELNAILGDESKLLAVIIAELREVRERFATPRKTEIIPSEVDIQLEDLIQEEDMVVAISRAGYIKRTPVTTYRAQKRGGKGRSGMAAREEDGIKELFVASTHALVFFFSDKGKVYVKKVYEVPEAAANARGRAIVNFVGLEDGERIAAITPVPALEEGRFVVTLTRRGQIKKTEITEYRNYRESGIIGVKIDEGDELHSAAVTAGKCEILIGTRSGMAIRFSEDDVRPTGRATMGVKGVELDEGDAVVGMGVRETGSDRDRVLTVCELGYGKQTSVEEFRLQGRGGKGVIMIDASDRNGPVVGLQLVRATDQLLVITDRGQTLRTGVAEIRETGRNAQGVSIMRVAEGERIVAIETFADDGTGTEDGAGEGSAETGAPTDEAVGATETPSSEDATTPGDDGSAH
jgi:DNA gyrase subunit A